MENINFPGEPERPSLSGPDIGIAPDPESSAMPQPGVADLIQTHVLSQPKIPKKRTKTGCLTCRQRRIKCGEEKPTCNNCIKSKRECKGYAQRLVFKDPLLISESWSAQQALFNPHVQSRSATAALAHGYAAPAFSQPRPSGSQPPVLAPRPVAFSPGRHVSLTTGDGASPTPNLAPTGHSSSSSTAVSPDANVSVHMTNVSRALPQDPISSVHPPHTPAINHTPHATQDGAHAYSKATYSWRVQQELYRSHMQYSHSTNMLDVLYAEDGDDYYDVESDEEPEQQILAQNFNQLNLIMASANRDESLPRSFRTYLNEPNILTSYHPTLGSSPLNNPKTARIFLHFIHSTGPSLSVFERHPIDPSTMFGAPVQAAQQGLWTYTLPFKALEHQGLLQAMLAVSSLHIAYLQQAPATVSLKHYHYALKRVGVAVGLPMRRAQVGTLAAALLLAYYEVMTAEHTKWNSHVAGAVNLIHEIDFAGITRDLRLHRRRTWAQRQTTTATFLFGNTMLEDDPFAEQESSIDPNLIGSLLGQAVNYDEFGQVVDKHAKPRKVHFTRKDIECYRIQCDLYWWCCKQDIIQSIVSGSSLFLKYSRFGQCPPRAGMGRLDAIYGSADHMWLLLGRISDFGNRDRQRKLKASKAAGMGWRPDVRFFHFMARFAPQSPGKAPQPQRSPFPSPPQSTGMSQTRPSPAVSTPESPPMYGMVPSKGQRHAPAAFTGGAAHSHSPGSDSNEADDVSYEQAEQEWESILSTLDVFSHALGPHFLPLPSDSAPPIATPFGPALQYRTQTIALIWAFHYMSRILLYRLHPSMPPAMMVASGAAASTTAEYAQIIGKIASGIYYPQAFNLESGNLSPNVGSCLIESTIPIFLAAVQYTDRVQRHWVVTRLREISRLAGWRSSEAIADGCETSWKAAAEQGRGPPYEPPGDNARQQPYSQTGTTYESTHPSEKRFVRVDKPWTGWARGIMSRSDDVLRMEMEDRV